jgi:hypothetical protein
MPDSTHQLAYQPNSDYCKGFYEEFFANYAPNSVLRGKMSGTVSEFFAMCFFLSTPE